MNEIPKEEVRQQVLAAEAKLRAKLEMLKSRTLLFGPPGSYPWCQTAWLASNLNLYEFTTIILDNGLAFPGAGFGPDTANVVTQRLAAIDDWIDHGHTLIIVVRNVSQVVVWEDGQEDFDVNQCRPFQGIEYNSGSGTQIEYCGPPTAKEFFAPWTKLLRYGAIISAPKLKPLLRVQRGSPGPDQIVGGIVKKGAGQIILVPKPHAGPGTDGHLRYLQDLAGLPEQIRKASAEFPDWADNFRTADEAQARDKIEALRAQISEIENAIRMEEEKISQAARLKTLFVCSGDAFVAAVSDALTELGLRVVEGPHPRADLIALNDSHGILAVEAKGLDGSAREANLRQTERWVADVKYACAASEEERDADADISRYANKLSALGISLPTEDINVKGLMVIGTFRKVPLDKRVEADFPDPLMRTLSRSEVCALTGLQLLLVILQIRKDPTLKSKFIERLFATSGQLGQGGSWKDFSS
jgi:hypothetical protein